jgi:hypothetical protein
MLVQMKTAATTPTASRGAGNDPDKWTGSVGELTAAAPVRDYRNRRTRPALEQPVRPNDSNTRTDTTLTPVTPPDT